MDSLIENLLDRIIEINKMQKDFLNSSVKLLHDEERELLEHYIEYCMSRGIDIQYLAESFNLIVKDTLKEQIYFKRHKKYRFSSYDEAASSVYSNDRYMKMYMHGLALSGFLWPQHIEMARFFIRTIPKNRKGKYLEIGPGHGFFLVQAMNACSFNMYEGIDISPSSVELTKSILNSDFFGGRSDCYSVYECDFLKMNSQGKYDAIVMGEVLEHVEEPKVFLDKISIMSKDDGYIYVSTCINAPAIDHIFLFDSIEHVEDAVADSGLDIIEKLVLPYTGLSVEETQEQMMPMNIAMVLKRK